MPGAEVIARLREYLAAPQHPRSADQALSTGCAECDTLLPGAGLRRGMVLEWLSPDFGSGISLLAMAMAKNALTSGGTLVICDRTAVMFPAALAIDMQRVVMVRAKNDADHLWAIEQALRSSAVAIVWARLARLADKASRRLQLAAEQGGAIGLLIRPAEAQKRPTWAEAQLLVTPQAGQEHRTWRITRIRARGSTSTAHVDVEWRETTETLHAVNINHATHPLSMVSSVGCPARA